MINNLISVSEASDWASSYLNRPVTNSNISYLVQYAKIKKYKDESGNVKVNKSELQNYYDEYIIKREKLWKKKLGEDLNWNLSFDQLSEKERTKHVHRLHPYKGKFIPQLVEYFLDRHTDRFKTKVIFKSGDIILDPFMGSGTTLIQASELGLHSIGIDISEFNCLISKVKSDNYNLFELNSILENALAKTIEFSKATFNDSIDNELKERMSEFNNNYFPVPDYKRKVKDNLIDDYEYGKEKLKIFKEKNKALLIKNGTKERTFLLNERDMSNFLFKWFTKRIRQELFYYIKLIDDIEDEKIKNIMRIILSRTARSCRATTHYDLATLKKPQFQPYYCYKHKKICSPINNIIKHLRKNTYDTIRRLNEYAKLKKKVYINIIHGDSRNLNVINEIYSSNSKFFNILKTRKIKGIFTSPPYVGQIDYHEQHAYAYELFNISRKDEDEIGPLYKGRGKKAREEYVNGISEVLINISNYVHRNCNYFIVANDKSNLYPIIAENCDLKIVNQYKRPVLNRTERDRQPYAETIFHMKIK